jgi:hypothetical protein
MPQRSRLTKRGQKSTTTEKGYSKMNVNEILTDIAREFLNIRTLETANSDSEDFHEVAVWSLKQALEQAYGLGYAAGAKEE